MSEDKKEVKAVFDKYARQYADKYADLSTYHDGFDEFFNHLNDGGSVLELACGPGNITKYILTKRPDLNWLGIDLAPNMISIAKSENPSADFRVEDVRAISNHKNNYDGIMMGFCSPYLSKVELEKLIGDCVDCLNDNGLLYLSTMEGLYEASNYQQSSDGKSKLFIYYHEPAYIQDFFKKNGLKLIWEKQQPFIENREIKYNDYIIIGQKIR